MERFSLLILRRAFARFFNSGFSVTELLVTIAVISCLLVFGLPSFTNFISRSQLSTDHEKLQSLLAFARTRSVTSGEYVVICSLSMPNECSGSSQKGTVLWAEGALAFIDKNGNRQIDLSEDSILKVIYFSDKNQITWNRGEALVYEGDGSVYGSSNGTFRVSQSGDVKMLIISMTGRVRRSTI